MKDIRIVRGVIYFIMGAISMYCIDGVVQSELSLFNKFYYCLGTLMIGVAGFLFVELVIMFNNDEKKPWHEDVHTMD